MSDTVNLFENLLFTFAFKPSVIIFLVAIIEPTFTGNFLSSVLKWGISLRHETGYILTGLRFTLSSQGRHLLLSMSNDRQGSYVYHSFRSVRSLDVDTEVVVL